MIFILLPQRKAINTIHYIVYNSNHVNWDFSCSRGEKMTGNINWNVQGKEAIPPESKASTHYIAFGLDHQIPHTMLADFTSLLPQAAISTESFSFHCVLQMPLSTATQCESCWFIYNWHLNHIWIFLKCLVILGWLSFTPLHEELLLIQL